MIYAVIENGKVTNLVESEFAVEKNWVDTSTLKGDAVIGGSFSKKAGFTLPVVNTPTPEPVSVEAYRTLQIKLVRDVTNQFVISLKADAAKYEIDTWSTQYNDYVNWLRLPESPTPFVDNLAKTRGLSREELFKKIDIKVIAISTLQGIQHAFEDRLKAAATQTEMDSVVAEFQKNQPT